MCPICQEDESLPTEKRYHVYQDFTKRNLHMRRHHSPEEWSVFIAGPEDALQGDPESSTLLSTTAVLGMRARVDNLFE